MHNLLPESPIVLRMLAHPLRWQLVQALTLSDQRVQELVDGTQQPYNLVSYHLKQLRQANLVALRRSDADGRDIYYSLRLENLQADYQAAAVGLFPGWRWEDRRPRSVPAAPLRVLFLCTHNSARSQMAESFLRNIAGPGAFAASAGSQPRPVHPEAIAEMLARGMDIRNQRPKHVAELENQSFDVVVTVCDRIRETCPAYPLCSRSFHWSIADPAEIQDADQRRLAFSATADELERRIRQLIAAYGER
jgi:protein-tyrosine-phosphatase/DNA-binding transcriptional ArsR family regulator